MSIWFVCACDSIPYHARKSPFVKLHSLCCWHQFVIPDSSVRVPGEMRVNPFSYYFLRLTV